MKTLAIMCLILAVGWYITFKMLMSKKEEVSAKEAEITLLNKRADYLSEELKKREEDVIEFNKRVKELEKAAAKDDSNFDWSFDISNSPVVKQLQKQCKSCGGK